MGTGRDSDSDGSEVPATQLPPPKMMPTLRASAEPFSAAPADATSAAPANAASTSSDSEEVEQSQELLTPVPQRGISTSQPSQPSQPSQASDTSDDGSVIKSLTYGTDVNNDRVS